MSEKQIVKARRDASDLTTCSTHQTLLNPVFDIFNRIDLFVLAVSTIAWASLLGQSNSIRVKRI